MVHIVSILKIEKLTKSCTLKVCSFQISFLLCKQIFILEFVPIYIKKLCKTVIGTKFVFLLFIHSHCIRIEFKCFSPYFFYFFKGLKRDKIKFYLLGAYSVQLVPTNQYPGIFYDLSNI